MTTEGADETISNIAERLAFFFSDANLRSDRFMQKQVGRDDDFGGSITVEMLLKFKSIQQYSTEAEKVVEAAKTLDSLLVVEEDKICRKEPMKKSQMDENIPLSLHVSNIPVEDNKYTASVAELRPLFQDYGKVMLVKLKWKPAESDDDDKEKNHYAPQQKRKMVPAGCCLVEFGAAEDVEKAIADLIGEGEEAPKKTLEVKGQTLKVEKLRKWIDSRKKAEKPKKDNKKDNDKDNNKDNKRKNEEAEIKEFTVDWKPGCVIELKGLDKETCDREALRDALSGFTDVYADYSRGQAEGAIRFSEPSDKIQELAEKLQKGELEIAGKKVESARVLEGEEEQEYWKKFVDFKNKQIRQKAEEKSNKNKKRRRN